jgi:predicted amidohydrolase/GNAT superfamily N-acetyltransferase
MPNPPIELTDLDANLELRPLTLEDHAALKELQLACFPRMDPWDRPHLESQLKMWSQSQMGLFVDGRLAASSAQLIVDYGDYSAWDNWKELSDNGYCTNHDIEGDTMYGIEIQVHPDFRGWKLSRRLYEFRKRICREMNLARIVIGGRLPGYGAVADQMTPAQYVDEVVAKHRRDAVLTAQLANGFVMKGIVPEYLPSDEDSAGYATCLEWTNLDYVPARSMRSRRATQPVRVSLVQYQMRAVKDFAEFEHLVTFYVDTASDYRADFVLFPELFSLQLLSFLPEGRPGTAARRLAEFAPRIIELFGRLAVRYHINIVAGSHFVLEGDHLFNVAFLFHRDGRVDHQKKLHVTPGETRWWGVQGGDTLQTFETDRGRVAILICYDVEFPEAVRKLADDGARLLFVPYNTNDRYGHQRVRVCAQARCIENHMFVVTAGCVGNLPFTENADIHYAQSAVLTPCDLPFARDGIAIDTETNLETFIAHDIDLELARRHRRTGTVQNWNNRRRDLYSVRWGDKEI